MYFFFFPQRNFRDLITLGALTSKLVSFYQNSLTEQVLGPLQQRIHIHLCAVEPNRSRLCLPVHFSHVLESIPRSGRIGSLLDCSGHLRAILPRL